MISNLNEKANISIKTPYGPTKRKEVEDVVLQATVLGPLQYIVTLDEIGKEASKHPESLYQYRDIVPTPPISQIDDILAVSKCQGPTRVFQNRLINSIIEE